MSDAHREFINSLLDDLFNRYVDAIAKARGKSADEVTAIIDNAPYSAQKAKEAGLIDGVAYRDEVEKELKTKLGYKDADRAADCQGFRLQRSRTGIAGPR